jgi:hypothetical protein
MRPLLTLALIVLFAQPGSAESFTSTATQFRKKMIYARATGEISQLSLRDGQVFLWDEYAASVKPTHNVKADYTRSYSDFAGAVTRVLAHEGQRVEKGDPLYECHFLEHVYTSCTVPASLPIQVDQSIVATYRGRTFEAKVLSVDTQADTSYVRVLIFNTHDERYWHLSPGLQVELDFPSVDGALADKPATPTVDAG